jgi:predicted porin
MQNGGKRHRTKNVYGKAARALAYAFAFTGLATAANADGTETGSMKDLPAVSAAGVTIYGAIDVGYAYQTHGAPLSGALYTGLEYIMFGSPNARKPISSITESGLQQTFVGLRVEEAIYDNWTAIAKLETGWNPTSGEIADACASLTRNNGKPNQFQDSRGDGSRCGQAFNGPAYAGVSNSAYGTLTAGRNNTLDLDVLATYDPMGLAYAFSLIGFSSTAGAGIGDTELARWDNSVKYIYQYGPGHFGAMYSQGGQDTAVHSFAYAFNLGFSWQGFSIDGVFTRENSAVGASSLTVGDGATGVTTAAAAGFNLDKTLNAIVSDNEAWTVGAKYTFDLESCCHSGGLKDAKPEPGDKVTLFAGYQRAVQSNPADPVNSAGFANNAATTIGGYYLFNVNNNRYDTSRVLQTAWAGVKYELPWGLSFTGAYYYLNQNSFLAGTTTAPGGVLCTRTSAAFNAASSNCAGNFNMGSFLVDYAFNKNFDVYAGVNYSIVDGGLASGFLEDNSFLFMTGIRIKF